MWAVVAWRDEFRLEYQVTDRMQTVCKTVCSIQLRYHNFHYRLMITWLIDWLIDDGTDRRMVRHQTGVYSVAFNRLQFIFYFHAILSRVQPYCVCFYVSSHLLFSLCSVGRLINEYVMLCYGKGNRCWHTPGRGAMSCFPAVQHSHDADVADVGCGRLNWRLTFRSEETTDH